MIREVVLIALLSVALIKAYRSYNIYKFTNARRYIYWIIVYLIFAVLLIFKL